MEEMEALPILFARQKGEAKHQRQVEWIEVYTKMTINILLDKTIPFLYCICEVA